MDPKDKKHLVQSSVAPEAPPPEPDHIKVKQENGQNPSKWVHFKYWYISKKKLTIPLTVLLFLLVLAAIPWTRYHAAALVIKKDYVLRLTDSTANTPISGATIAIGSKKGTTDGNGVAVVRHVSVGNHQAVVAKENYKSQQVSVLVPLFGQKIPPIFSLVATGRQVKIVVTNLINHQRIAGAQIEVANTKAKTDFKGTALVVLPANAKTEKATLSAKGYNDKSVTVQISCCIVKENDFNLTPAGKVYFLSKLSGKIDVVKTNLDGSTRQTVVAGTGKEDDRGTVLLATRDWNYLALLSNRDGAVKLYVINTDDDKLINMDQGSATFRPVGWHNHYFVYFVERNGYNTWQPNAQTIKSYNADNGRTTSLASSNASGSNNDDAHKETLSTGLIMGDNVVFTRNWFRYGYSDLSGKQNVLTSIHPDGTASKQIKTLDANDQYFTNLKLNNPKQVYFGIQNNNDSGLAFYALDKNVNTTQDSNIKNDDLYSEATTYLYSPSGNQTFWHDERDGKQTLFTGDQEGANSKQIASLSQYKTYGWFTNDYLLISKNGSELYIMQNSGIKKDSEAIKVSDYHKPSQEFYGYGGGYGGI